MAKINKPLGRVARKKVLQAYGYHLVYGEGTKTEPNYANDVYNHIPKEFHNSQIVIETVPQSGGHNTLDLIQFAETDIVEKRKERRVDHVWIFYDKDSFPRDRFDNSFTKIGAKNLSKNKHLHIDGEDCDEFGTKWHAIWNNECFEIWVLLHFENLESALPRRDYIPKINEYLAFYSEIYSKGRTDLYEVLLKCGKVKSAIRFAKKLDENLARPKVKTNPSTGVYIFVEYFERYLNLV